MAKLVLGMGVPHTPYFPAMVRADATARPGVLFDAVRRWLEAAAPDRMIVLTSDHFVKFFLDNMPAFCVGIIEEADGPYENSLDMPRYRVQGDPTLASALLEFGLGAGFDLSSAQDLRLDHSMLVPLHFLTPGMSIPIIPVYINGLSLPLPRAERCYRLGQLLRQFVGQWPGSERVAVLATGSFSLEVGGPRMGSIDRIWAEEVVELLRTGQASELVHRATPERLREAGNTAGELLTWLALVGALEGKAPTWLEADAQPQDEPRDAHAYAVWEV